MATNLIYNSDKFDSCLNTYREKFSNIVKGGISTPDQQYEASIMVPLDFSLEMDGISGIIPNSAFEIPSNSLPSSYLTKKEESKIAFILHTVEHNFNDNKWTTKITGQTLNIRFDELSSEDKTVRKSLQEEPVLSDNNLLPTISPVLGEKADFWALVALSVAESYVTNPQSIADVAQSVYNRLGAKSYGASIKDIVIASGQYEPTFNNLPQWKAIKDKETAIIAYQGSKRVSRSEAEKAINIAYNAIQNTQLIENARSFVGSRTEFLAGQPNKNNSPFPIGMVERSPSNQNNVFFWKYAGKTKFYNERTNNARIALPKPAGFFYIPNS